MIKLVGYLILLFAFPAWALVPVEGILMGEAREDIQTDPLRSVFSEMNPKAEKAENHKIKLYQNLFSGGQNLVESCSYLGEPKYHSTWTKNQARRTIAATLQYIGLDTTIKAIGAYAKNLKLKEEEFKQLADNITSNYCSKNVTVFSLKSIRKTLQYYYENPQEHIIPSLASSPYATKIVKITTEYPYARSSEFDRVIENFRAFCSWGGEVEDFRMLTYYLKNPFIMSFTFKNLIGRKARIDGKLQKIVEAPNEDTVQVACTDLICRKTNLNIFNKSFPQSMGSTSVFTDLSKIYCHDLRFLDFPRKTIPNVKAWVKEQELEDPILETSQFIALMSGIPDLFHGAKSYAEIPVIVKSSVDERWNQWSNYVIGMFSKDLQYEESLRVRIEQRTNPTAISMNGFEIDISVTLGELDRIMTKNNDFDLFFELKLSKNYLRSIKSQWAVLGQNVDMEGKAQLKEQISRYLEIQLRKKEKLFAQKMWSDEFPNLIADELVRQVVLYKGPLFDQYKDEVLEIPVNFSYGLFALNYLRYRADIAQGRSKLNL